MNNLDFYKNKRILVVGPDGFIGYNMLKALNQLGADVSIITRHKKTRVPKEYYNCIFHGDLRDYDVVKKAVSGQDIIFDFAGLSGAVSSNQSPFEHLQNDCGSHLTLFRAAIESNELPLIVFCSSRMVYGKPEYLPVNERHPLSPLNIYGTHKITIENYLRVFHINHGLPYIIVRLSNPYGPYQPLTTKNYGIINLFIKLAAYGEPITIFGDGSQKRDYVYIDDVINSFLSLAMNQKCYGQIFNYGGSEPTSIKETVEIIDKLVGNVDIQYKEWPAEYSNIETGDYQTDLAKINEYIGPQNFTSLEEGILETLNYYKKIKS